MSEKREYFSEDDIEGMYEVDPRNAKKVEEDNNAAIAKGLAEAVKRLERGSNE